MGKKTEQGNEQEGKIPTTLEKLLPKKKHVKDIHKKYDMNVIKSQSDDIVENEIKTNIEGKDNAIEVITNKDSSIILLKKDVYKKSEKLKSDNVSWSIFEMLKNVIKMPFKKSLGL